MPSDQAITHRQIRVIRATEQMFRSPFSLDRQSAAFSGGWRSMGSRPLGSGFLLDRCGSDTLALSAP
jgi:hypothetical protein